MIVLVLLALLPTGARAGADMPATQPTRTEGEISVGLSTVPPTPVGSQVVLDLRTAVRNRSSTSRTLEVAVYLDAEDPGHELHREKLEVPAQSSKGVYFKWRDGAHPGRHQLIARATADGRSWRKAESIEIVRSRARSLGRITGAWAGIVHFNDGEAERWNTAIRKMTDSQWRGLIRDMHGLGMNTVVITQVFLNDSVHYGAHQMEEEGYPGRALYPSRLYSRREPIAGRDPIETVLATADELGMHVFLGVGIYAFFDFTPASLEWHKRVTDELYSLYGHHRSLYGWYVSDELKGALLDSDDANAQVAEFFREYRVHCRALTPEKPIMLAPNCFYMPKGEKGWPAILRHLDILCPFGWNRMPAGDTRGTEMYQWLQRLCDQAGTHLWMDQEVFLARRRVQPDPKLTGWPLWPRPIEQITAELARFPDFEKVLCFQYPGMITAPEASPRLGGEEAVKLFLEYRQFLQSRPAEE